MEDPFALPFTIVYAITMLVALVGNTLLIYIVWKKPATRSLTSFLFVNMAVADLLCTMTLMPTNVAHFYASNMTDFTCGLVYYASFVSVAASILCLTVMAFDRYYAVVHPFRQSIWFRKPKFITPIIWITSMALMSVSALVFRPIYGTCFYLHAIPPLAFWIYILVITYIIPLATITILYSIVVGRLWLHQMPSEHETSQEQQIPKKKIVRMLIIIVAVFAVCWLPVHVLQVESAVHMIMWPGELQYFCYWLAQANSAINPWLYIGLNGKMNAAFTRLILCRPDDQQRNRATVATRRSRASSTKGSFLDTKL